MTYKLAEFVQETTTSTGTGTINLAGASTGYQGFVAAVGSGALVSYCINNLRYGGTDREVGLGVVTDASPDSLSRDVVLESSNGGALVNLASGTHDVLLWVPVSQMHLGYTKLRMSDQTGFTNTLTDLTDMTWPVRAGERYRVSAKFNFALSGGTSGVRLQIVAPSATGCSISYFGTGAAGAWAQNIDKNSDEVSGYYVTQAATGFVHAWGYVDAAASGTAKFQGQSGGSGVTAIHMKGSSLHVTRVAA